MGKKGKRHGRGGGGSKRSAARQSSDGLEGVGSGGGRRTAGGGAIDPAPTAEQNPIMSGILAKTLPDLPVRTFRFPPNASRQKVFEVVLFAYMGELNPRVLFRGGNDSTGILSVIVSALCLPLHLVGGVETRLSALLWWYFHLQAHHQPEDVQGFEHLALPTSFTLDPFIDERSVSFLRRLSKNKVECSLVRVVALILRADIGMHSQGKVPSSQEAALRRRAINHLANDDMSKIPNTMQITGSPEPFSLRESLAMLIKSSRERLDKMQQNSWPTETPGYWLTVGGNVCDCCGKSMKEASIPCLFQCSRCRLAHYCGASCQTKAWECGHSLRCKKFGVFEPGDRAILHSLRNITRLNGKFVLVTGVICNGDKFKIELVGTKRLLCVKKKNLRHLRPQS